MAIGFAVLKYRLYDIDIIINRTLVYGSLTTTLVGLYFGSVATTQTILRALTGQTEQPQIAIVVSTLVIAALFNPLRRRLQTFIDRRFYRRKYDARKTLEEFSTRLREETDLDALSDEMVGVVRETMQPEHVKLWLRPELPRMSGSSENLVKWSRGLSAQEAQSFSLTRRAHAGVGGRTSRARTSSASRA